MRNLWRTTCSVFIFTCLVTTDAAALPVHQWSHGFGDNSSQSAFLIAIDQAGNVIIAGDFSGTVDFGGGPLTATSFDGYVAKFDPNGNHLWSKNFGGAGGDEVTSIDVDATNHIAVAGTFETTVYLGGDTLTSAGGFSDIFVAKLDPNGNHVWSKSFGDTGTDDIPFIRIGGAGEVGMCATFQGTVDFGGGPLASAGGNDVAVVKFDSGGNHVWSHAYGDAEFSQHSRDIDFDASGNVVFLVQYRGTMDFGGDPLASAGDYDIGLAKLDPSGNHVWSKRFGNASMQHPRSLGIDAAGNVFTAGYSYQNVDLGGGLLTNAGQSDIFVAKYDAAGNHLWSDLYGDAAMQQGGAYIAIDAAGNLLLISFLIGSIDFGGGPVTSGGLTDMVVAKLDPNGVEVFATHYGGTDSDLGYDVAVNSAGDVMAIAGNTNGTIDFGGGPIVTAGFSDALVAAFSIDSPVPVLIQTFEAIARKASVELRWDVSSDEEIARVVLWRGDDSSPMRTIVDRPFDGTRSYVDSRVQSGRQYDYQLVLITESGDVFRSAIATAKIPGTAAFLEQNYPNPFNPRTTIAYTLEQRAHVAIVIYDAAGIEVARLEQGVRGPGRHVVEWDGRDTNGKVLASGVYFSRLDGVERVEPRKMVLLR